MLRRSTHPRAGMSLIELLVVIAIIVILMSLLVPAVMRTLVAGPKAKTTSRIAGLGNAIGTFKSHQSFGQVTYIPPGRYEPVANPAAGVPAPGWYPFRLRNQYANPTSATEPGIYSFEAQYLARVFAGGGTLNWNDLGMGTNTWGADLDANQTLTFFLGGIPESGSQGVVFTGFATHPQQPFRPRGSPTEPRRGERPILEISREMYEPDASGFPRLMDAHGMPFAYFAAIDGKTNAYLNGGGYNPLAPGVRPYSRNGQFENASGFQLISAGKNKRFGTNGDWTNVGTDGEDDQVNFSDALLGAGPK